MNDNPQLLSPSRDWSYDDTAHQRLLRARRATQVALGAALYHLATGERPILRDATRARLSPQRARDLQAAQLL